MREFGAPFKRAAPGPSLVLALGTRETTTGTIGPAGEPRRARRALRLRIYFFAANTALTVKVAEPPSGAGKVIE